MKREFKRNLWTKIRALLCGDIIKKIRGGLDYEAVGGAMFLGLKKAVVNPINKKIGAYYGCLLLRPSGVMAFDNPENPTIIEDFIRAIGGTPVVYPFRNECCGAYVTLKNSELPKKKSEKVLLLSK